MSRALDLAHVELAPDLADFARQAIEAGRYRDIGEALDQGLRLLQRREEQVREFQRSLEEAEAESDRDGWVTLEEALARADKIIATLPE